MRSETLRQEYLGRTQVSAAGTAEGKGGADAAEGEGERPIRAALWRGLLRALPLALALQFFLVTSTSTRILRTFNCIEFPTRDAVLPGGQEPYRAYLADDLSLDCSTPEYATAQRWAYVLLFVWPIGEMRRDEMRLRCAEMHRDPRRLAETRSPLLSSQHRPNVVLTLSSTLAPSPALPPFPCPSSPRSDTPPPPPDPARRAATVPRLAARLAAEHRHAPPLPALARD